MKHKVLVFGASGAIGTAIQQRFNNQDWEVVCVSRQLATLDNTICWNPLVETSAEVINKLHFFGQFDAVCWSQGANCNDSIFAFNADKHRETYDTNVVYIMQSLHFLLTEKLLKKSAKLCIISSIWQNISRQNKLSYGVTKSALKGLVLSLANDLGADGYLINAVLPGALNTPMTHQNLSVNQINSIKHATQFSRLAELADVANTVYFLCSADNSGVTGQFVKVDLGFSDVRII